jgi:TonB family protein
VLDIVVDKKGKVHDPMVIHSGGNDVDKQAIDSVRQWRFMPSTCGTEPVETKISVEVTVSLR